MNILKVIQYMLQPGLETQQLDPDLHYTNLILCYSALDPMIEGTGFLHTVFSAPNTSEKQLEHIISK